MKFIVYLSEHGSFSWLGAFDTEEEAREELDAKLSESECEDICGWVSPAVFFKAK